MNLRKNWRPNKPDELTYKDTAIISHMLRNIISISNIFVKSLHRGHKIKQIEITVFQVGTDGICKYSITIRV